MSKEFTPNNDNDRTLRPEEIEELPNIDEIAREEGVQPNENTRLDHFIDYVLERSRNSPYMINTKSNTDKE